MKTTETATDNVSFQKELRKYLGLGPAKPEKFYHEVMSAALTDRLIRHYLSKGYSDSDIAVLCTETFEKRIGLYCGGVIEARVFTYTHNYRPGVYDIVISTKEKSPEHAGFHKILHNSDDKKVPNGFDEVYNFYTHKNKKKLITTYPLNVPQKRKWKQLFKTYPDYYRDNYMCLKTPHFHKFIELRPEVWEEDGLWRPNFDFSGKNDIRDKVYQMVTLFKSGACFQTSNIG